MRNLNIYFAFALLMFFAACESKPSSNEVSSDVETLKVKKSFPFNEPKVTDQQTIGQLRSYVRDLIIKRQENMREDLFDLTYYYFSPRGFSNLNKVTGQQAYAGFWAKFKGDYTYEYGIHDQIIGSGIYHYAGSDTKMFMLDNDVQLEPKMWNLKANSEFFNFIGRPIMVLEDNTGHGQILMSNYSNDKFLQNKKVLVEGKNGTQIMMALMEQRP